MTRCPDCGGETVPLSRKFKPPSQRPVQSSKVVEFLVANGFRFDSMTDNGRAGKYPMTMAAAKVFVARHAHRIARQNHAGR